MTGERRLDASNLSPLAGLVGRSPVAGARRGLAATRHLELFQNVVDVVLDGRQLDAEHVRDLLVRHALLEKRQNLLLTSGQRARGVALAVVAATRLAVAREPLKERGRKSRRHDGFAASDA